MRVVDMNYNTLERSTLDLQLGYLILGKAPKLNAIPIDNVTKFAWEDSDFEEVEIYQLKRVDNNHSPDGNDDRDAMLVDLAYRMALLELQP